ncbi:MAG: hypothetical protein KatS3mg027_2596 [Bacteroidia bacterium]|nr:MAG: hypothetical protein KatS3mg027_2596 [Bacteroidia bacterium]
MDTNINQYETKSKLLILLIIFGITSCDPAHQIKIENKTSQPITVIFKPLMDSAPTDSNFASFETNDVLFGKTVLKSGQVLEIGTVAARYNPQPDDIDFDYLEIHIDKDTMKLIGKLSIFSVIQEVDKLDWRLVIKNK